MRTRILFLAFLHMILVGSLPLHAQENAGKLLRDLADELANNLRKKVKNANLPKGCKIYVMPFRTGKDGVDTLRTRLGLKLATELSHRLGEMSANGDLAFIPKILSTQEEGKYLHEIQLQHLQPPATMAEESEFYKRLSLDQKPDFYLTGAYEIDASFTRISLVKTSLVRDKFNEELSKKPDVYIDPLEQSINTLHAEQLKKWDSPLIPPADAYLKLIQFDASQKTDFATMSLINGKTNAVIKAGEKLRLGMPYQLKAELTKNAYLYAFYYESQDPLHKMYMIGPLDEKSNLLAKAGTVLLPDERNIFEPSPPADRQAIVKLIASTKKMPLSISTSPEGYVYLSAEEAMRFVSILERMDKDDICASKLLYEIE
jgi:hypothetical protein